MRTNRSSTTAQLAALARTAQFKERGSLKGTDDVAERFLDPFFGFLAKWSLVLDLARWTYGLRLPGAYEFVLARTLFFDEMFMRELTRGARQVVLLGAGFDSRPYRFAAACHDHAARVFELDVPATSAAKQAKVRNVFGKKPTHVSYVPIDFNTTPLLGPLLAAGYNPNARTIFVWEGVTFYLTQTAIDAVLRFVAMQSGAGSVVVFDYADARILKPRCELWGAERSRGYVSSIGEPFTFGISPEQVSAFLAERGLACDQDLSPSEIERRFLVRADGSLFGQVAGYCRMAVARVPA